MTLRIHARARTIVHGALLVATSCLVSAACGTGDDGQGGAGGAGSTGPLMQLTSSSSGATTRSVSAQASTTQVNVTAASGGLMCVDDGTCRIEAREACGMCDDCVLGTPDCGGCNADGTCDVDDACTCADCRTDPFCSDPTFCSPDGACDFLSEGCVCDDCKDTEACAT